MNNDTKSIIDRIQKLLRLAKNAGSEHEAAIAAQRAAEMMAQHEIHEAEISLDAQEPRVAEEIARAHQVTSTKKKVAWHMRVINGVARSYGARAYWHGGAVQLFGRLSAVQAANYTAQYLMREIETITDSEAAGMPRSYRNAFRLGCATRLADRLDEQAAAKMAPQDSHADAREGAEPTVTEVPHASAGVIAVIRRDRAEVDAEYARFSTRFRSSGSVGQVSSGSGYAAGQAAGGRVTLGGGRAGLPRGQGSLR